MREVFCLRMTPSVPGGSENRNSCLRDNDFLADSSTKKSLIPPGSRLVYRVCCVLLLVG